MQQEHVHNSEGCIAIDDEPTDIGPHRKVCRRAEVIYLLKVNSAYDQILRSQNTDVSRFEQRCETLTPKNIKNASTLFASHPSSLFNIKY